ncbi:MAG: prepilin-type N-terminal cleavage/methylation domain-containing protein [Rhodanobacteraceae bacterium]
MRRQLGAAGFTLLEVMLATLLLSLLLAGTFGAVRTTVKAMHSGEAVIDRTNRLRVAQEFIRHQISRTLPLAFGRDDSTGVNFMFQGDSDFMRFVAPMPGYLSRGGAYVQTLELSRGSGGKQLLFTDRMLNGFDLDKGKGKDSDMKPVVLLDQIQDGKFEYRTFDDDGNLGDWTDKWDDPSITPVMVRLHLDMQPQARVTFAEMDIPLMLDVGTVRRSGNQLPSAVAPRGAASR